MSELDAAAVPVVRDTIIKEFADGDLAVRVIIAAADVDAFWRMFPEKDTAAYLACERGAIEVIRDTVMGEYKDGALSLRVLIHPKDKAQFRELWPRPEAAATLAREAPARGRQALISAAIDEPPLYGQEARTLRTHLAFVANPKVWAAVGSDDDFLIWLRTQPCAVCRRGPHWENSDYVPSEAAHVRRVASGAGTATKPAYSAVPLCHLCHGKQHQHGESAIGGREWLDSRRIYYLVEWVWDALKAELGYEHWNLVPPPTLYAWAEEHDVVACLPACYRVDADGVVR